LDSNILIVEDEIIIAADLKVRLENLGYNIFGISATGNDAIRKTGETHPDLVLMDIMLKGDMDGIDTAQKIRDLYDIPVIYLTAYFDDEILNRAKITEPFGYILKPFEDMRIQSAVEMAVYNHHIEQKLKNSAKILEFSKELLQMMNNFENFI
ncbi:MAG TPA: response regulator, partial [Methanobacterium sp.]